MDLRSVLNDSGDRGRDTSRDRERSAPQPPTPQQKPHQLPPHHQHSPASYPQQHREYPYPQQSPGKPPSREYEYHAASYHQGPPQSPYQQPPYPQGRPGPPPALKPTNSFHDVRSPSGPPGPSPTAYRPTPTPTAAPNAAGYFPPQDSPVMRPQSRPESYPYQQQQSAPQGLQQQTAYPYQQRSASQQSTPTPTPASAQYGSLYGSPVATHRSQPPTPQGPPLSATTQKQAPYPHQSPTQFQQPPPPPPPPQTQTHTHSQLDSQAHTPTQSQRRASVSQITNPPFHDREHSMSVSPKTRLPSIAGSTEHITAPTESRDRAMTPAKRKMEDRDDDEPKVNGERPAKTSKKQSAPAVRPTRKRYAAPPIWAQNVRTLGEQLPKKPNFVLQKRAHPLVNGNKPAVAQPPPQREPPRETVAPVAHPAQDLLGDWEPTITNLGPPEDIPRVLADFLFFNIIKNPAANEIHSKGIKFEIEAKLGTLIDRDTNDQRVDRGLLSEAILADPSRVAFKSRMTESTHKSFNEFLNATVKETHEQQAAGIKRVPLRYLHRYEIDQFVDMTPEMYDRLPDCMNPSAQPGQGRRRPRVRVTRNKQTGQVIAQIVKARVADLDFHIPWGPMDCRISINLEMDWDGPPAQLEDALARQNDRQPDRRKDRLSYTQGPYQIDLTQVTQEQKERGQSRITKEHELEIELDPGVLIEQGNRADEGRDHRYLELVTGFVDNIRLLARKADEMTK